MCKIFKVDRVSYYRWVKKGSVVEQNNMELNRHIKEIFVQSRSTYGTRRIKSLLLQNEGLIISRRRIGEIMKKLGLSVKGKRKFKINTTDSNHSLPIANNILNRNFYVGEANQKYVGDITYIPTNEGWLYLATVIDLYSRKIVGWSMSNSMKTTLVNDALKMAIQQRRPKKGLLWHTDRGSQYASYEHRDLLEAHGIIQSMSRKGNCWDNAVAESFFHTLKTELTHHHQFQTKAEANQAIFEYIEVFYNRQRIHSANNNLSPVAFEEKMLLNERVA